MKLNEAIAKVHESIEGRYGLTGEDLYFVHGFLCSLQDETLYSDFLDWFRKENLGKYSPGVPTHEIVKRYIYIHK